MNTTYSCISPTTGAAPSLFASAINFIAASQCILRDDFKTDEIGENDVFDFIIVGAGTAGSVLANRLSEISSWSILLLEAGPQPPIESDIPELVQTLAGTKYDWQYKTKNNGKTSQAVVNGSVPWPRGKTLGGSSSINNMLYVRGNIADYKCWRNAGNPNWTTENIIRHFKKAESMQNAKLSKLPIIKATYGFDGPQILNRFNHSVIDKHVVNSYDAIGFTKVTDLNAAKFNSPGISGIATMTAANEQRYSTYQAYLLPARKRKNLKIVINAFVTKVLIDENLQAYGVEVDINGKRINVTAKLEVILSAGVINTPQLLMLSGIGAESHLTSKGITCKVNLPAVGKNLQDHISVPVPIFADKPEQFSEAEEAFNAIMYLYNKTGLYTQDPIVNVLAFYARSKTASYPEFETHLVLYRKNASNKFTTLFSLYKDPAARSLKKKLETKTLFFFFFNLLHPLSRGTILLNTSNPYDKPLIDANYFGDPRDLQATAEGIRMLTKIVNAPYFRSINASLSRIDWPECNNYTLNSEAYWQCQAKNMVLTVYHPVGTSRMGPNCNDSVVDNFLKVHKISGLRVIDASIMTCITSGNTNGPTIMIGEMGSSMIKEYYGKN